LSRHRKIQVSRSKAIVVVAAGALSVATAASATAATWSVQSPAHAGLSGRSAGTAPKAPKAPKVPAAVALRLSVADQLNQSQTDVAQQATLTQRAYRLRAEQMHDAMARWLTAQRQAAAQAARKAAAAQAAREAAARTHSSSRPQADAVTVAASGSPEQIARAMLGSFGWSSSQFACLEPLWAHESGWSVTASNPTSGAYGIPQALPGSKMASAGPDWQNNAATQIRWGLEYIKGSYGSPCGAWNHELATGWY
jgi:hypothetical protein